MELCLHGGRYWIRRSIFDIIWSLSVWVLVVLKKSCLSSLWWLYYTVIHIGRDCYTFFAGFTRDKGRSGPLRFVWESSYTDLIYTQWIKVHFHLMDLDIIIAKNSACIYVLQFAHFIPGANFFVVLILKLGERSSNSCIHQPLLCTYSHRWRSHQVALIAWWLAAILMYVFAITVSC